MLEPPNKLGANQMVSNYACGGQANSERANSELCGLSCYFLGFGVGFGSLLGVSQQGTFSILPLALHLYVPSFCFTHMVSFGSTAKATVAKRSIAKAGRNFMFQHLRQDAHAFKAARPIPPPTRPPQALIDDGFPQFEGNFVAPPSLITGMAGRSWRKETILCRF